MIGMLDQPERVSEIAMSPVFALARASRSTPSTWPP